MLCGLFASAAGVGAGQALYSQRRLSSPLLFPILAQLLSLSVSDVAELLDPTGIHFGGEHAVVLVAGDADQSLELPRKDPMAAKRDQQLGLFVEDLHPVLLSVGNPDMAIRVNRNALRSCEVSRSIAGFAKGAHKLAIGVEDLDAIVQRVANV